MFDGFDKFGHERLVGLASQPRFTHTNVERIVEQRLVVGADIEHHRQALMGMNPGTRDIKRQFTDRNAHAAGAEIAEADRQALRDAGFSDRDIFDIASVAGFFNMSNRVASATDMRPNRAYHAMAR